LPPLRPQKSKTASASTNALCEAADPGEDVAVTTLDLAQVADRLRKFTGEDLTSTLARIERSVQGVSSADCSNFLLDAGAGNGALAAAASLKRLAGQINVAIHALGILLCLPHILEAGEKVEYVSLGAGNTGREFDLETNLRVAEFKFIHWRGGPESIRQNSIFKDFFFLAECAIAKRKYLYVLGTKHPLKFLTGGRALSSVLSKDKRVRDEFYGRFGERFRRVRDYYEAHRDAVIIEDVSQWIPELLSEVVAESEAPDTEPT
jgi:hypothetical protein